VSNDISKVQTLSLVMASSFYVKKLFADIAKRYELVNHLLCLGIDYWWRYLTARRVMHHVIKQAKITLVEPTPYPAVPLSSCLHILDLATGSGNLATAIQVSLKKRKELQHTPIKVIGADFCRPILEEARGKGIDLLVEADGLALPFKEGSFDAVTIAFGLRNMESWQQGVDSMYNVLKPGGKLFILDFSLPTNPLIKPLYRFYLHYILPHIAGWVTGHPDAYEYLGASIEEFPSGKTMLALLESVGFQKMKSTPMTFGIVSLYEAEKALF
jgi:demethylmenaquinone methyltransferase / 2-methoxy-6-polyprenyl-1,4-benzoquinol methylase